MGKGLDESGILQDDVRRAAEVVRAADAREKLAAFALDALSRQAEGRALFAGKEVVEVRAAEHGVTREDAETVAGNLLAILERGPAQPSERALVAAFAVAALAKADDETLGRFVRHADWLTLSSPYRVYPFVDVVLDEGAAACVWEKVAVATCAARGEVAARRATHAARLTALAESGVPAAKRALVRVADDAQDPMTRTLANALVGRGPAAMPALSAIVGQAGSVPRGKWTEVFRYLLGIALLQWLASGAGYVLGVRRPVEVAIEDGALKVRRSVQLLGRTIRQREETWTYAAIAGAGRSSRYPAIHLVVGVVALSAGVLLGGMFLFDGVRSGETVLLLAGAGLALGGAALDLALSVLAPGTREKVAVEVDLLSRRGVRLVGVHRSDADAFLAGLGARLPRR